MFPVTLGIVLDFDKPSFSCFLFEDFIFIYLSSLWYFMPSVLYVLIYTLDCHFSGIPGCAKSALCKELLNAPGGLGDDRPVHSLMGDLIKGWNHACLCMSYAFFCTLRKP